MPKVSRYLSSVILLGMLNFLDISGFVVSAWPQENLKTLQQEVVQAKEQQAAIANKVEIVNAALENEKSRVLKEEANGLMDELIKEGYSQGPDSLKYVSTQEFVKEESQKKLEATKGQEVAKEIKIAPAKNQKNTKPKKIVEKKKPFIKLPFYEHKEEKLSDGQALYKVAVSDDKITLDEAVDIGLANDLQAKAALQKVRVAQAKLTEARRALFPTVQASYINPQESGGKQSQSSPPPNYRIFKTESYKINVNQPLYYGGELVLTVKQAKENIKSAEMEYKKIRNDLIHKIRGTYYSAVKAEYNVQYQVELYNKTNAIYKKVLEGYRQKVISESDYLNVESQYQQVFYQVESSNNELLASNMALRQEIGVEGETPIPLDLKLEFFKLNPNYDALLQMAYDNNPDYLSKKFSLDSAKSGLDVYEAKKKPHLDLKGSYGKAGERIYDDTAQYGGTVQGIQGVNRGEELDFNLKKEWFLGIKGSMPLGPNSIEYERIKHVYAPSVISPTGGSEDWSEKYTFNLLDKFSEITDEKSALATLLQAEADYKKSKDEITSKIKEDYYTIKKTLIQIDSTVSKIRYRQKQNAILEYLIGLQEAQIPSLVEGLVDLAQDKFSFIQAVIDYDLAISNLSISIGDPYYLWSQKAAS